MSEPSKLGRGGPPIRWRYDLAAPFAPRIQPQNAPPVPSDSAPYTCVKVSRQWIPHIIGALDTLTAWDAWAGIDDGYYGRQEVERIINQLLVGGCETMPVLRQNPLNDCQLQQSLDSGATWQTVFDYGLCKPAMTYNEITNNHSEATTIINEINNRYDGNSISIMPYVGDVDNATVDSLCLSCRIFVSAIRSMVLDLKKQQEATQDTSLGFLAAAFGAGASVAGGVAGLATGAGIGAALIAASPYIAFGLAAAAVGTSVAALFNSEDLSAYEDNSAWDELTCIMYQYLKGRAINQNTFKFSIAARPPENANAAIVRRTIQPFFESLDLYLIFLDSWAKARDILLLEPTIFECECSESEPELTGEIVFNFLPNVAGWERFNNQIPAARYAFNFGWYPNSTTSTGISIETVANFTGTIREVEFVFSTPSYVMPHANSYIDFGVSGNDQRLLSGIQQVQTVSTDVLIVAENTPLRVFINSGLSGVYIPQTMAISQLTIRGYW